jgi:phage/plasmid-associated DNA primase
MIEVKFPTGSQVVTKLVTTAEGVALSIASADTHYQTEEAKTLFGNANPDNLISFSNGVLDPTTTTTTTTSKIHPHHPDFFTKFSLPVAHDPSAQAPRICAFLAMCWPDPQECAEQTALFEEFLGYTLTGSTKWHRFAYLIGTSGSGKGTLLALVAALVGHAAVAHTNFTAYAGPHFGEKLIGKRVLIFDDVKMPDRNVASSAFEKFNTETGGGRVIVNKKGGAQFDIAPPVFWMAANQLLTFQDDKNSLRRRTLYLTFNQSFGGTAAEDPNLVSKLTTADELSGLLNMALAGLARLNKNGGFTEPKCTEHLREIAKDLASPTDVILRERFVLPTDEEMTSMPKPKIDFCIRIPATRTTKASWQNATTDQYHMFKMVHELYATFNMASTVAGIKMPRTQTQFVSDLKQMFPQLVKAYTRKDKNGVRHPIIFDVGIVGIEPFAGDISPADTANVLQFPTSAPTTPPTTNDFEGIKL